MTERDCRGVDNDEAGRREGIPEVVGTAPAWPPASSKAPMSTQPLQTIPITSGPLERLPSAARMIEAVKAVYREGRRELDIRSEPEDVAADRDRVAAMEEVLKRALRDREERLYAQNLLAELRLHQERWLGKWLADNVNHSGGGDRRSSTRGGTAARDLPDGISKNQSSAFQRLAAMSAAAFDRYLSDARDARKEITTAGALKFSLGQPTKSRNAPRRSVRHPLIGPASSALRRIRAEHPRFGTVLVDPPWKAGTDGDDGGGADGHLTLSVEELARLPVGVVAAEDSHLHLLVPDEFLFDCPRLLSGWGFTYRGVFVWTTPETMPGSFWQVAHVCMVLGARGGRSFIDRSVRSWAELRTQHRAEAVRSLVRQVSPGPYLDLFGRSAAAGWVGGGSDLVLGRLATSGEEQRVYDDAATWWVPDVLLENHRLRGQTLVSC